MNVNFSAWSIRNPVPAILLFVVLCVLGLLSFSKLPVTRFPNIDVPLVSVTVTQSGAAPAELENQVSKRVEDSVANITGVKHVTSTLTDGDNEPLDLAKLEPLSLGGMFTTLNEDRLLVSLQDTPPLLVKPAAPVPATAPISAETH